MPAHITDFCRVLLHTLKDKSDMVTVPLHKTRPVHHFSGIFPLHGPAQSSRGDSFFPTRRAGLRRQLPVGPVYIKNGIFLSLKSG